MGTTKTKYLAAEEALKTMESQLAEAVNNGKLLSEKVKKLECKLKDFGDISTDEYLHFHEQSIARVREEAADKEQELVYDILIGLKIFNIQILYYVLAINIYAHIQHHILNLLCT